MDGWAKALPECAAPFIRFLAPIRQSQWHKMRLEIAELQNG